MTRNKKTLALTLTVIPILWGCGHITREEYDRNIQALTQANDSLKRRNEQLEPLAIENDRLKLEISRSKTYEQLSLELRNALDQIGKEGKGPLVKIGPGQYEFQDDAFFESGKFDIKSEAKKELIKLAATLKNDKSAGIYIVGHTDSDKIEKHRKENPTGMNLELGANRAIAVADVFNKNGIDESRMFLHSAGANQHKASNSTAAGKKTNRRVDIFIFKLQK